MKLYEWENTPLPEKLVFKKKPASCTDSKNCMHICKRFITGWKGINEDEIDDPGLEI